MLLNEPVMIALLDEGQIVWQEAVIVGRTLEADPRYDVRLQGGQIIVGVPASQLRAQATYASASWLKGMERNRGIGEYATT